MEYNKLLKIVSELLYDELIRLDKDDAKVMRKFSLSEEEYYEILPDRKPEAIALRHAKEVYQNNAKELGVEPKEFDNIDEILEENSKIVDELYDKARKEYDAMTPKEIMKRMIKEGCSHCRDGEYCDFDDDYQFCDECPKNILEPYITETMGVKDLRRVWCPAFRWS